MEKEKDECALKRFLSERQGFPGSLKRTGPVLLCSAAGGKLPDLDETSETFSGVHGAVVAVFGM